MLYLYYDHKKGLVKADHAVGSHIQEHSETGYNHPLAKQEMEIPERGLNILVTSNFGFGFRSYHTATVTTLSGQYVLNFMDREFLSIQRIAVNPGDWDTLFDKIIELCDNIHTGEKMINHYFDCIDNVLDRIDDKLDESFVKLPVQVKTKRVLNVLAAIADALPDSIYCGNTLVKDRLFNSCSKAIKFASHSDESILLKDVSQIEKSLQSIFKYMASIDGVLEVLRKASLDTQKDCTLKL